MEGESIEVNVRKLEVQVYLIEMDSNSPLPILVEVCDTQSAALWGSSHYKLTVVRDLLVVLDRLRRNVRLAIIRPLLQTVAERPLLQSIDRRG